jgi:hypothetical protein
MTHRRFRRTYSVYIHVYTEGIYLPLYLLRLDDNFCVMQIHQKRNAHGMYMYMYSYCTKLISILIYYACTL